MQNSPMMVSIPLSSPNYWLWLRRISRDEGLLGLFKGVGPTMGRAMALNTGMLASNDQVPSSLFLRSLLQLHYILNFLCAA